LGCLRWPPSCFFPGAIFGLIGGALFGPASLNIPLSDLAARLGELASSKRQPVAIVCRTDKRSAKAAELLIEASFADVAIVRGGMEQWQREGFVVADATTG
jgi:rhodanese-related sulfurtransferase